MLQMSIVHAVKGLDPVADVFDTVQYSHVVNLKNHHNCLFTVHIGVGATGTQTFTVEACDDVVPTNVSAIPFHYRQTLTGDTPGAITATASTGITDTAGSSKIIEVEIESQALATSGYGYVRLKSTEVVNSPVLGGILVQLFNPRYAVAVSDSAIV